MKAITVCIKLTLSLTQKKHWSWQSSLGAKFDPPINWHKAHCLQYRPDCGLICAVVQRSKEGGAVCSLTPLCQLLRSQVAIWGWHTASVWVLCHSLPTLLHCTSEQKLARLVLGVDQAVAPHQVNELDSITMLACQIKYAVPGKGLVQRTSPMAQGETRWYTLTLNHICYLDCSWGTATSYCFLSVATDWSLFVLTAYVMATLVVGACKLQSQYWRH